MIVVEVLSESTALSDLTRKRQAYKTILSLRAIIYISPDRARIDLIRRRADGTWNEDEVIEGLGSQLSLSEIGLSLPLSAIYADTEVEAA